MQPQKLQQPRHFLHPGLRHILHLLLVKDLTVSQRQEAEEDRADPSQCLSSRSRKGVSYWIVVTSADSTPFTGTGF
jgi:hypothetical protein